MNSNNPLIAYTNNVPQWMRTLQYELDSAEWMVSETLECPALTEEMAINAIMGRKAR